MSQSSDGINCSTQSTQRRKKRVLYCKLRARPDCDSRPGSRWSEPAPGGVGLSARDKVVKVCRTAIVKDIVPYSSHFEQYSVTRSTLRSIGPRPYFASG